MVGHAHVHILAHRRAQLWGAHGAHAAALHAQTVVTAAGACSSAHRPLPLLLPQSRLPCQQFCSKSNLAPECMHDMTQQHTHTTHARTHLLQPPAHALQVHPQPHAPRPDLIPHLARPWDASLVLSIVRIFGTGRQLAEGTRPRSSAGAPTSVHSPMLSSTLPCGIPQLQPPPKASNNTRSTTHWSENSPGVAMRVCIHAARQTAFRCSAGAKSRM